MRLEDLERDRKAEERPLKEAIKQIKADVREQMRERERARAAGQEMLTADVPEVREEAAQAMPEIEALDTL